MTINHSIIAHSILKMGVSPRGQVGNIPIPSILFLCQCIRS